MFKVDNIYYATGDDNDNERSDDCKVLDLITEPTSVAVVLITSSSVIAFLSGLSLFLSMNL